MIPELNIIHGKQNAYMRGKKINERVFSAVGVMDNRRYVVKSFNGTWEIRFDAEVTVRKMLYAGGGHKNVMIEAEPIMMGRDKFIVMPCVEGEPLLCTFRRHNSFRDKVTRKIVEGACDGLYYLHQNGVIHRDIKLGNIYMASPTQEVSGTQIETGESIPKIFDFDCVYMPQVGEKLTSGPRGGTQDFIAPELWDGAVPDERSDLYALGLSIYELATRCMPYPNIGLFFGKSAKTAHQSTPPKDPRTLSIPTQDGLAKVLLKSLEKDPDKRFQSALEFKTAFMEAI